MVGFFPLLIVLLTWSLHLNFESNWTPSTFIDDLEVRVMPFIVIAIYQNKPHFYHFMELYKMYQIL